MSTIARVRQLTDAPRSDSRVIGELVALWRESRQDYLQFLTDLHGADEDRDYLCGTVFPQNMVYVAEVGEALAGFIAFATGWVNHLYVAPAHQGQGVGSELLMVAKRCNPSLQLWVFEVNRPAVRFYEGRGFRVVERTDGALNEAKQPDLRMQWRAEGQPLPAAAQVQSPP